MKKDVEKLKALSETEILHVLAPSGQKMSRDAVAITAGLQAPPHIQASTIVLVVRQQEQLCKDLSEAARLASEHLARKAPKSAKLRAAGTHIFIGHGRSPLWRELKDFVQDKLHLPADEFNRVPVAGITNIARLSEMMESAAFAFIIMTAEDETAEGTMRARMNVVHEVGLFQGKLGFARAIVLLEDGCDEFTNIQGLGQIRFPKGNIKAAFQDVREVLERERVLES